MGRNWSNGKKFQLCKMETKLWKTGEPKCDCSWHHCIVYLKSAKRVDLGSSHLGEKKEEGEKWGMRKGKEKEKWQRCEVMDTYIDLVVVNISQCIQVSGHQFVNLKFIQFFIVNYPSKLGKNKGASGKFFLVWILVL